MKIIVINCINRECNGIYNYKKLNTCDNNTLSFFKDKNYQLYRYKGVWRLAKIGEKIYFELKECKNKEWDIEKLDLIYLKYDKNISFKHLISNNNILDKKIYNEININNFLIKYKNKNIIYIPNRGNAGDSLIAYGTLQLFKKNKLNYKIGNVTNKYKNKILFYAGGGNLVSIYSNCKNFLINNKKFNEIVLLPHTIKDEDKLIKSFENNIKIICREKTSYNYVYNLMINKNNIFLSKDMALHINNINKYKKINGKGICNCFRCDREKTNIKIPKNNIDLSVKLSKSNNVSKFNVIEEVSFSIFNYLSKYKTINTNRLHMAIAGCLLNKNVNLYSNSYYKNKSIFDYSLNKNYKNIKFKY